MKYKDRKDAKRKYKQTLLATVATMTLGVSTLGSTASAFAEEKDQNATQQQNTVQQKSAGTYYAAGPTYPGLAAFNTALEAGSKGGGVKGVSNYTGIANTAKNSITILLKDVNSENFNNTARNFAMLGVGMIPGMGAFISPLLSLLWPESGSGIKDALKSLEDKLIAIMDDKITAKDITDLQAAIHGGASGGLVSELSEFEDSLNDNTRQPAPRINQGRITAIQSKFSTLLGTTSKKDFEISELPLFTLVATAHLTFMDTVKKNGTLPKIGYTQAEVDEVLHKMEDNRKDYIDYIEKMYKAGEAKINEKISKLAQDAHNKLESLDEKNFDKTATDKAIEDLQDKLTNLPKPRTHTHEDENKFINEQEKLIDQRDSLKEYVSQYTELLYQKSDFYSKTKGSEAFQIAATGHATPDPNLIQKTGWVANGGHYTYIDTEGHAKTDWFNDKKSDGTDRYYYLSTGTPGLDTVRNNFQVEKGTMLTGWFHDTRKDKQIIGNGTQTTDEYWYYLSPEKDFPNSANEKFEQGQMMTKWVEIEELDKNGMKTGKKHWYYFNPEKGPDEGKMTRDQTGVKIGDKKYDFDSNGVCTTPNGY